MANVIDSLLISIGLRDADLIRGFDRVEKRITSGVRNLINNVLTPLAAALGFKALFGNFLSDATELSRLSRTLRADAADIDAWGAAIQAAEGNVTTFRATLLSLEDRLRNARFGGGNREFRALGITPVVNGQLKTSLQVLEELAQLAGTANFNRFERLAKNLGIDEDTIQLLRRGGGEVEALLKKYRATARTQEDAKLVREFNISVLDLVRSFKAWGTYTFRGLIPILKRLNGYLETGIDFIRRHEPLAIAAFTGIATVITARLIPAVVRLGLAWLANPMTWIIGGLILLIGGLGLLIDDLWTYANGGESALGGLWSRLGSGKEVFERLQAAATRLKSIASALFGALQDQISRLLEALAPVGLALADVFTTSVNLLLSLIERGLDGSEAAFASWLESLAGLFTSTFLAIGNWIFDWIDYLTGGLFSGILDGLEAGYNQIVDFLKGVLKYIPDTLLPQGLIDWRDALEGLDAEATAVIQDIADPIPSTGIIAGAAAGAAIATPNTVTNSNNITINISAPGGDPRQVFQATQDGLRQALNLGNKGVMQ